MKYHMIAFAAGFLLDLLIGDPYCFPHPVRWIGTFIAKMESILRKEGQEKKRELYAGFCLTVIVILFFGTVFAVLLFSAYRFHRWAGVVMETLMTYQILATKCLKDESMKVYECLKAEDLPGARKAVSMIVGRDTQTLSTEGVAKAAIETVAENTSDGVIAPMLYTALGGPVLGFVYKAINTMDSMIGYKNERYLYFGRSAAKLDDIVNYLPSRISAYFMVAAAFLSGEEFSGKRAWRIYRRDNRKHASPNSAQTEAVCAGALGIRLAGNASYFGKIVEKPYIGDSDRTVEYEDIRRADQLLYKTAVICEILCLAVMYVIAG